MASEIAVLNQLNFIVGDIRASANFYRQLGVQTPDATGGGNAPPFHANCETGNGLHLDLDVPHFAQVWNSGWIGRDDLVGKVVVGFSLPTREKVDEVYTDITKSGYRALQPPFDAFWGARYAIVEDPNGIAVGLMSPADPERRYWPPPNWKG